MGKANTTTKRTLSAVLVFLLSASPAFSDDTALFAANYPPNVLLFVDNSGSMNIIMYHPAFDITKYPFSCDIINGTHYGDYSYTATLDQNLQTVYIWGDANSTFSSIDVGKTDGGWVASTPTTDDPNQGYITRKFCGQTRRLYLDGSAWTDGSRTWWLEPYLEWYFSLDPSDTTTTYGPDDQTAAEIIAEIEDEDNGREFITGHYFGKHQRARISAARNIASDVIYQTNTDCPAYGGDCSTYYDRVRFGLARFQAFGEGGFVAVGIDEYSNNKSDLEAAINALDARTSTPLGETLFNLYTYFMSRTSSERPKGKDDSTRFPEYEYRTTDGFPRDVYGGTVAGDPVQEPCQKNFIIMITDGEPTSDNFSYYDDNWTRGFDDFEDKYIGDYAEDEVGDVDIGTDSTPEVGNPPWISSSSAGYLDDIAAFIQDTDMRLDADMPGKQTIDVYTVGFVTEEPVNTLLKKTADAGNGLNFLGNQAETLTVALVESISDIIEKSQSFTAATVPASRATDGNNFFASYFVPGNNDPYWAGHLKLFEFNAKGEIRDKPVAPASTGACALDDPLDPTRCLVGRLKIELDGYWDAADEVPAPGSRNLYTSVDGSLEDFDDDLDTDDLDFGGLGITMGDVDDYDVTGGDTSGISDLGELRDAIVNYVRGCEFDESTCVDRGDGAKLWDIFHSNPLVIGPPNSGINEDTYRQFVERYKHRKRVIYAGSNGGFVHGFNAGEYNATLGAYERDVPTGGREEFGFMSYWGRNHIAELPRDTSRAYYFMDGSPQAADVWLYPEPDEHPADGTVADWRTVLMGGMRQGGRVIWALDVTNPTGTGNVAAGPSYPGYLWEFPCEGTDTECVGSVRPDGANQAGVVPTGYTLSDYMGETWSEPVITRVKVTVNCTGTCESYDRWVAIFGAGYDPLGNPNLTHNADTGVGTRATDTLAEDYDASNDLETSRAGRAIFMVDITSGEVLAMKRYHHDATNGDPNMKYAFAARPAVFDLNFDGYADVVYIGDLGGNIWKWVISEVGQDPINGTADVFQPSWKFLKIMEADGCSIADGCASPHFRSFFAAVEGALVGSTLWLTAGTGERTDLSFIGTDAQERNRHYVFRDKDPLERELTLPAVGSPRYSDKVLSPPPLVPDFVNVSTLTGACVPPASNGFYIEGEDGEKFITDSQIFFGVVLTGSYLPTAAASPCEVGGEARLYGFQLFCGEGVFPPPGDPSDPKRRKVTVGGGLPNQPRVSVGPVGDGGGGGGDCEDMVIVITSDGETLSDCPGGRPDSGTRVRSWREN